MEFTKEDHDAVAAAIREAEKPSARAARVAARSRPSRRTRAVRVAQDQPHAQSQRCADLRLIGRALLGIVADEGIAQKVQSSEWEAAIEALTAHLRNGRIAAGFIAAIERCGTVLAEYAPPDGSANELPDRLYVI